MYIEEKHELLDNLGVIGRDFFDYIFGSDESFIDEDDYRDIEKKHQYFRLYRPKYSILNTATINLNTTGLSLSTIATTLSESWNPFTISSLLSLIQTHG